MRLAVLTTVFCLVASSVPGKISPEIPYGLWLTENQRAIIEIAPCQGRTCGRIVWMANPYETDGTPKRDVNNPDTGLRDRPLCGLTLIGDLIPDTAGESLTGFVYNPRNGKKYGALVSSLSDDMLEMRGFVGLSIFGKSQTWKRVMDRRNGC
ncbi:MAG: DUF2147 domain-containing protein [Pseudomonadota bacterium]